MIHIFTTHGETIEIQNAAMKNNNFDNRSFHRHILTNFDMSFSSFINCDFRNAEIKCCYFKNSNLEKAKLIMVDSKSANYENAKLSEALLIFSDFSAARFKGADLTGAKLENSRFDFSDLRGAIFKP